MAGEQVRFVKAQAVWDDQIASGNLSMPEKLGDTAILLPYYPPMPEADILESYPVLRREALDLWAGLRAVGKEVIIVDNADKTDFKRVLTDPQISSVVVVGRGSLSSLRVPISENAILDWEDIAEMADHLKERFVQRFCGYYVRRLNVPLGLFAVSDHRNVFAPAGSSFMPVDLKDKQNALIKPVTNKPRLTYQDIKDCFAKRD